MVAIRDGYGEYVIARRHANQSLQAPSYDEYQHIFRNLIHPNSPHHLVHQARQGLGDNPTENAQAAAAQQIMAAVTGRYEALRQGLATHAARAVQNGGVRYEIIFVPRTLYEILLINQVMYQEINTLSINWPIKPMAHWTQVIEGDHTRHAFPTISVTDANVRLAQTMNTHILGKIAALGADALNNLPLTDVQLRTLLGTALDAFRDLVSSDQDRPNGYGATPQNVAGVRVGPRLRANQICAQRNTVAANMQATMNIEMVAAGYLLLYRGSEFQDNVEQAPSVLSYNTGFWATLLYDVELNTSTPEFTLTQGDRIGRCVAIPWSDLVFPMFPFYVPLGNTLDQLHGTDQQSHSWSKANEDWARQQFVMPQARPGTHWEYMIYNLNDRAALNREVRRYPRLRWHPAPDAPPQLPPSHQAARERPLNWTGSASKGLVCVRCGKAHGQAASGALGRWHLCQSCNNVYCNICGKWTLWREIWGERERACSCGGKTVLIE